jgi:hypothetical protein
MQPAGGGLAVARCGSSGRRRIGVGQVQHGCSPDIG